jgi:primosomal protein N' (replication factor Y)
LKIINELTFKINPEQEKAFDGVMDLLDVEKGVALLNAVTGAGKTLVYMYLIREILEQGKSVLLLVPEIALTNNLYDRFERAFPNKVSIYHSKMPAGSKYDLWHKIKQEKGHFVIGTRSAVFLPFSDLELTIIDEEHDSSFKQSDKNPRYNARDVAIIRAKIENSTVLLASATPSLESYYNAKIGLYKYFEIDKRADNAVLPKVRVMDMMDAKIKAAVKGHLSRVLFDGMLDRIAKKEQVILFLNRRGYSAFIMCRDCGDIKKCKRCDVALTYHKKKNLLYCHYCGYNRVVELSCNECGRQSLSNMGIGTEQIEEEIKEYFDKAGMEVGVRRLDSDTAKNEKETKKIINDFQENKFQILIGTQILAKGLNFKNLSLVGIINSDLELYRSDFRANERTFQLLEQVAGRAGRTKELQGEVIIQTYSPDNYAIKYVQEHNYIAFANTELIYRESSEYPPIWRMNKIIISGKSEREVKNTADYIFNQIYVDSEIIKIYKPVVPSISMINNKHRQFIFIKIYKAKDKSGKASRKIMQHLRDLIPPSQNIKIDIDIDTYSEV